MTTTKAKLEFVWAMARHTRATVRQCLALMRYAGTLQRLAEDDCNIPMDDSQRAKWEAKKLHIRGKIHEVLMSLGPDERDGWCHPVFSGDPRGAVLKIRVPDGFSDSFGGEGICVPS